MSIRNKLIIFTFFSTFITLVIVAISIDYVITDLYNKNAKVEIEHSYSNLLRELDSLEKDTSNQSLYIAENKSVIAITNLVNRYQDKKTYQTLIFNDEKKKISQHLLNQITLTKAEQSSIYSKHGDLISYAIHTENTIESGFISYENGAPLVLKQTDKNQTWHKGTIPESIRLNIAPLNEHVPFLPYAGKIKYTSHEKKFIAESSRIISRGNRNSKTTLLGIVKVRSSLNESFFQSASEDGHTKISLQLHSGFLINPIKGLPPIDDLDNKSSIHLNNSPNTKVFTVNNFYISSYLWPTEQGKNYILTTNSRAGLVIALSETRYILMLIFIITAALGFAFNIYWLNRLISKPLNALTIKATSGNINHLPTFPVSKGNDEISLLGKVLNKMVDTIRNRENQLLENKTQLNHTQKLAKIGGWKFNHKNNEILFSNEIYSMLEEDKESNPASQDLIKKHIYFDDIAKVEKEFNYSIQHHMPFDITHRIVDANGKIKTVHVYSETLFDEKGNPISTKGTMQDISEQTIKDEQLRRTQKLDAIGKLTGGVAHDFNNMLGVILGFAELLQDNPDTTEKQKKYLSQITSAGMRASSLTSKLLAISRKDSDTATCVDINQVLLDEQIMLEKTLTVRIKLNLKLPDDLWTIWLEKNELEDAIMNMSINAMHAMPSGGELTLSTQNTTLSSIDIRNMEIPAGDYVTLSITDSGTGMTNEILEKIFEPFFTTKNEMGTGLGMSQVYGFVKRSHGTIDIHSELGHGTRITLYFPRYQNDTFADSYSSNEKEDDIDLSGSSTLLVVDDEKALRDLANDVLSAKGYKVLTAESAEEALKILDSNHIDLVLSDVIMPGIDGYELAKIIKERHPGIKIQIISGYADIKDPEILNSSLYNNRLQKPYTAEDLLKTIKTHLF